MTFTDQDFTRLPFLNIRKPVLSLGPICHLGWAPRARREKKTPHADGNVALQSKKKGVLQNTGFFWFIEKQEYFSASTKSNYREVSFFFFLFLGNVNQACTIFVIFSLLHIQSFGTFTPASSLCLKSPSCCTLPAFSPAAAVQCKPASPDLQATAPTSLQKHEQINPHRIFMGPGPVLDPFRECEMFWVKYGDAGIGTAGPFYVRGQNTELQAA